MAWVFSSMTKVISRRPFSLPLPHGSPPILLPFVLQAPTTWTLLWTVRRRPEGRTKNSTTDFFNEIGEIMPPRRRGLKDRTEGNLPA